MKGKYSSLYNKMEKLNCK